MPTPGRKPDTTTTEVTIRQVLPDGTVTEAQWHLAPGVSISESRAIRPVPHQVGGTLQDAYALVPVPGSRTLTITGQVLHSGGPAGEQVPHGVPVGG